jgi:hypothetical protein
MAFFSALADPIPLSKEIVLDLADARRTQLETDVSACIFQAIGGWTLAKKSSPPRLVAPAFFRLCSWSLEDSFLITLLPAPGQDRRHLAGSGAASLLQMARPYQIDVPHLTEH